MRPDTGAAVSRRLSKGIADLGTELGPPLAGPVSEAAPGAMLCGEVEGPEQYEQGGAEQYEQGGAEQHEQGGAEQESALTFGELKALAQALADAEIDTEPGLGAAGEAAPAYEAVLCGEVEADLGTELGPAADEPQAALKARINSELRAGEAAPEAVLCGEVEAG